MNTNDVVDLFVITFLPLLISLAVLLIYPIAGVALFAIVFLFIGFVVLGKRSWR